MASNQLQVQKVQPIISITFDNVIHSYSSGWQGIDVISDAPVPGALVWLLDLVQNQHDPNQPKPVIWSDRSLEKRGRLAMKHWLWQHGFPCDYIQELEFPVTKPPAYLSIDDRAIQFMGRFPTAYEMIHFAPWSPTEKPLEPIAEDPHHTVCTTIVTALRNFKKYGNQATLKRLLETVDQLDEYYKA